MGITRYLGQTAIELGQFGFGLYPLSDDNNITGRKRPKEAEAIKTLHEIADAGVIFFDTANAYCRDDSEEGYGETLLKKALSSKKNCIVATKGIASRPNGGWALDGRPESMRCAVEGSLKRLNIDCIDLYQVHGVDTKVPLVETVGELFRLQEKGKIQHIGLCNVDPNQAQLILEEGRIESIQNCLNPLFKQDLSNGMIEFCVKNQLTYIAYSPFGGFHSYKLANDPTLRSIAQKHQCTPYDIALSWLFNLNTRIVPIHLLLLVLKELQAG